MSNRTRLKLQLRQTDMKRKVSKFVELILGRHHVHTINHVNKKYRSGLGWHHVWAFYNMILSLLHWWFVATNCLFQNQFMAYFSIVVQVKTPIFFRAIFRRYLPKMSQRNNPVLIYLLRLIPKSAEFNS